jgi:hypothetical protein
MKRIQFTTRYKGGGGGGVTTVESIPAWARPYMEKVAQTAEGAYGSGQLDNVAGTSGLQEKAFTTGAGNIDKTTTAGINALQSSTGRLEEMAKTGSGFTGGEALKAGAMSEAGKAMSGLNTQFGSAGTLGSARNAIAGQAVQTDLAAKFAGIDKDIAEKNAAIKMQAEQGISGAAGAGANIAQGGAAATANLGGQQRTIEQQQLDAPWQALNRYASTVYGLPAKQSGTATGGGGK